MHSTRDTHLQPHTAERGVPRKYYALTDSGRQELQRLTDEWTTFAKAMAKLLRR